MGLGGFLFLPRDINQCYEAFWIKLVQMEYSLSCLRMFLQSKEWSLRC